MKKFGVVAFIIALVAGLILANMFSFGRFREKFFNISFNSGVTGSGNIVTDKRNVSNFKGLDVGGIFKVEAIAQKDFGVEVEIDDNLVPMVNTEVRDGILHIELEGHVKSRGPILVRVFAPNLESIESSGASNISVSQLKNSSLSVSSSGASKISVAGETAKLTVGVSGASNIDTSNLKAVDANIEASGASHVDVFASGKLSADASGASRITYSGSPTSVDRKTSGASSVKGN
jgi:hypothetical protein